MALLAHSLTKVALLALLLAGITLMALFAYNSPLPSQATLHDDQAISPAKIPSALVISASTSIIHTYSIPPAENPTIYADPDMLSTNEQEDNFEITHPDIDSGVRVRVFRGQR